VPSSELFARIRTEIETIALLDTHEHLPPEAARVAQKVDFFSWFPVYASSDLLSAGMPEATLSRVRDPQRPLDDRWAEFAPWWEHTRTTGYGRQLRLLARELFGIDAINERTVHTLSEKMHAANRPGWYAHVLRECAHIERSVLDPAEGQETDDFAEVDRSLFVPVCRVDRFITVWNLNELRALEERSGMAIHSLDQLLAAMDVAFERAVEAGAVGLKLDEAYRRPLGYNKVPKADAERVFDRVARYPLALAPSFQPPSVSWREARPLQDFMTHQAIQRAIEHHLPIQVHTGLQEGSGNYVADANPLHLVSLLLEYREARFDLFHAGYPFVSETATLGKNFPNVTLDMCWVHIISPWVARRALHEWLETVPANKIFAFGADSLFIEGVYAHARMARENVARVLTEKVEAGYLDEDEAVSLAHKLLHDNAARFFGLQSARA
jgi:uncharacterized protein